MSTPTKANDRQVAGNHYGVGNKLQHWDVALAFDLDYFQGQITKYVMRWKLKHPTPEERLEDLKKAQHFLEKYIEEEEAKLNPPKDPTLMDQVKGVIEDCGATPRYVDQDID